MKIFIKWLLNGIVVAPLLMWFSGIPFVTAAAAATVLTYIAYFIGDQLILRVLNNTVAVIADFFLAGIYIRLIGYIFNWNLTIGETLIISFALGAAEWVFHRYVLKESITLKEG